jgi:guanylate kinase
VKKVILIAGFSASGKDTLARALSEMGHHSIVSSTTRPMRPGEENGIDYNFREDGEFLNMVHDREILEFRKYDTEYKGEKAVWYYGTEFDQLVSDKINVAVVDFDGVKAFKSYKDLDVTAVFIHVEDEVRKARCIKRGDYDEVEFTRRLKDDREKYVDPVNWDSIDFCMDGNWEPDYVLNEFIEKLKERGVNV